MDGVLFTLLSLFVVAAAGAVFATVMAALQDEESAKKEKQRRRREEEEAARQVRAQAWCDEINPVLRPGSLFRFLEGYQALNSRGQIHCPKLGWVSIQGVRRAEAKSFLNDAFAEHAAHDDHVMRDFDRRMREEAAREESEGRYTIATYHGDLLSVAVRTYPSGAMKMKWEIRELGTLAYAITVREDYTLRTQARKTDHIDRFLKRGRDYKYSFTVYDETMHPDRHGNRPNLEENLLITVNIPTMKQWAAAGKGKRKSGRDIVDQLAGQMLEQREAEQLIDQLRLAEEDADFMKARVQRELLEDQTDGDR